MQDSKKTKSRKAWYQKAMQVANLWRIVLKFPDHHHQNHHNSNDKFSGNAKLRKCSSTSSNSKANMSMPTTPPRTLSYPSSLTRSCLCSPISYTDSFRCDLPPRRSVSSNGSSNYQSPFPPMPLHHNHNHNHQGGDFYPNFLQPKLNGAAINGYAHFPPRRKVFRGKSVMDNSLMRRSVIEEEAMMMKRSIEELAFVQRKNSLKRRQLGPSPLSRVVMAADC